MAVRPKLISLSAVVAALLFAAPLTTSAQPAARVPSVGSLSTGLGTATSSLAGDLAALGYVEGKTIILHLRYSERRVERLPALAVELVQLNVDVIVACAAGGSDHCAMSAHHHAPAVRALAMLAPGR
jgi:hypothetical protein